MDYDPERITYEALLDIFWSIHSPVSPMRSAQYASLILCQDESQLAAAHGSKERLEATLGRPLYTRIAPLDRFYVAEDYHQKYYLRQDRVLAAEFRAMFGADEAAFRESTAAARVNGFVAGDGDATALGAVLDQLGLSDSGRGELLRLVGAPGPGIGCSIG